VVIAQGAPGDPLPLPDLTTGVRQGEREWQVEGGGSFRPADVGAYYLVGGADTLGAISANLDPRESLLESASDDRIRELWKGARVTSLGETADLVFAAGAMADFRGPLLLAALLLGVAEVGLASLWRRER
jgi:hypothetical protein